MITEQIPSTTALADIASDLSECEREPIAHPGSIQSHGCLVALNSSGIVTHASENLRRHLPWDARESLGKPLARLLGEPASRILREVLPNLRPRKIHYELWEGAEEAQSLWIHSHGSRYLLEWERLSELETAAKRDLEEFLPQCLAEMRDGFHLHRQLQLAAELTSRFTGFDRVMVYRFLPDWSGEVVAEVRQSLSEPFLGLRYPASDIPPQARKLYTENLLRLLVDVHSPVTGVMALPTERQSLDLTFATLRALSPYHIQYLKNMKVGATATASIVHEEALWGLIACHHDRRKAVSPSQREILSRIASTLSDCVRDRVASMAQISSRRLESRRRSLEDAIPDASSALGGILFGRDRHRGLVRGCGTAVWTSRGIVRMGDSAAHEELERYARSLLAGPEDVVAIDSRAELVDRFRINPQNPTLAGFLSIVVSRDPGLILFAFRPEEMNEIVWGGDINKPVERSEITGALSPRRSFAEYKQKIAGQAAPWTAEDLATARIVKGLLSLRAPAPGDVARLIEEGLSKVRALVSDDRPIQDSLLDAIGNGISLLYRSDREDPTVRYANQSLLDLAATCSRTAPRLLNAGELLEAIGVPETLLAGGDSDHFQVTIPSARYGVRHFLVERKLALEVTGTDGTVSLSALLFTDTTRSERAREALKTAQEKAENLASLKSAFLSNMSHEIRTPMNGILGMVQLMRATASDPRQLRYLDVIHRSGDELLDLLNGILDLSRLESGQMEIEKTPFDLVGLIGGTVEKLRPKALEKSLALHAEFALSPPGWFLGDPARLRQVLLNIAGNAIKFTNAGGVSIRIEFSPDSLPNAPVVVSVSDTGIGISESYLPHIFDKFRQADPSITRNHGGSGLGLAIAHQLVGLMGGQISIASRVGVGSTFTVSLPLPPVSPNGLTK